MNIASFYHVYNRLEIQIYNFPSVGKSFKNSCESGLNHSINFATKRVYILL